ncbi:hypothetical protein PS647_06038 [Pseudomonas fluorescens]|nr:hypothetical protein PS647_06038 [Pseudomonas fluorescens]
MPAEPAQGAALVFGQLVPLVPGGMPELVEQPVLRRYQPGEQGRIEADALASFREYPFDGDEAIVLGGQHQWPIQVQHTSTETATASITETGPDLVQGHVELVIATAAGAQQTPTQLLRVGPGQIAEHSVTGRFGGAQTLGGVEITTDTAPLVADVEEHFQAFEGQAFDTGVTTFETNLPDPAQGIRQALAGNIRHLERSFAGGDRRVRPGQFAMPVIHRRHGGTGQRQTREEPSSRNRHCPTCVSHGAGFIQARTIVAPQNLRASRASSLPHWIYVALKIPVGASLLAMRPSAALNFPVSHSFPPDSKGPCA